MWLEKTHEHHDEAHYRCWPRRSFSMLPNAPSACFSSCIRWRTQHTTQRISDWAYSHIIRATIWLLLKKNKTLKCYILLIIFHVLFSSVKAKEMHCLQFYFFFSLTTAFTTQGFLRSYFKFALWISLKKQNPEYVLLGGHQSSQH